MIKLVHHATLKEDELSQRVVSYFKDRFVTGEAVLGIKDGEEKTCRIISSLEPVTAGHDCMSLQPSLPHGLVAWQGRIYPICLPYLQLTSFSMTWYTASHYKLLLFAAQTISTAAFIAPPDPEDEYRVEWQGGAGVSNLKRRQLIRQKVPLTRAVFKSWLHLNATEEAIIVSPLQSPLFSKIIRMNSSRASCRSWMSGATIWRGFFSIKEVPQRRIMKANYS